MSFDNTLLEAEYEGVRFPVQALQVSVGNASVAHKAYRRPGADVEDCGQEPYTGTLSVPCLDVPQLNARYSQGSPCWPDLFLVLDALFKQTPTGRLVHPTLGVVTAHIDAWPHSADPSDRSGVVLQVTWTEHNDSVSLVLDSTTAGLPPTDSTSAVSAKAYAADTAAASRGVAGWKGLGPAFDRELETLALPGIGYADVFAAVRAMAGLCSANLALAGLDDPSTATLALDVEQLRAQVLGIADQMLGTQAAPQVYVVPCTMAAWEVAGAVYGDISMDGLILAANAVADPGAIPGGTSLVILPRP